MLLKTSQLGYRAFFHSFWVPGSYIFFLELQNSDQFHEMIEKSLLCSIAYSESLYIPLFKENFLVYII